MISAKALALALAAQGAPGTFTVDDAIRIAEMNAFSVRTTQSNVKKAKELYNQLNGNLGPQLSAQAAHQRFSRAQEQFSPTGSPKKIDQANSASATLSYPIDITGVLKSTVNAQLNNVKAQEAALAATRNNLRNEVRRGYFDVLRAELSLEVNRASLKSAQEQLRVTNANVAQGTAAKVDVLRVEAQVKQFENSVLAAENTVILAKAALNNTLARPVDTDFDVVNQEIPLPPTVEEAKAKEAALKFRPELEQIRYAQKALKAVTRTQEGGLLPSLGLGVSYQKNLEPRGPFTLSDQTVAQITLSVPLFDSGITRAKVRQAREDENQAKIQLEQTQLAISLQVRSAARNLQTALDRLKVADAQVAAAEEALRLSELRDKEGEGIVLEVLDAQQQLVSARISRVNARYDVYLAYADLQRAVGRDEVETAITQLQSGGNS